MPKSTKFKVINVRNETNRNLYVSVCDSGYSLNVWISEIEENSNHLNPPLVEPNGQFKTVQIKKD